MRLLLPLVFLLALPLLTHAQHGGGDRLVGQPFAGRSPVLARNGMAATSHPLATQVAVDILQRGGSAVDAAIAANAALGLMEPTGNGIGGDLFAIVWDPETREVYGLNASGRSPQGLTYDALLSELDGREQIPLFGALPVSVPGAVDGWFELHERFGTLPMTDILQPTIDYAREGFPVTQVIGHYFQMNFDRWARHAADIEEFDNARATYLLDGRPPAEGQVFRNPDLANTLAMIAEGGREAFYEGEIADVIDAYMQRIGGYLRKADLATHRSEWVAPESVEYRGVRVYELPPNGQGIAALQQLQLLEAYDLAALGHNTAPYLHLQAETKKVAFADRARFYADPAFTDIPIAGLLSDEYADQRRALISETRAMRAVDAGNPRLYEGDTIYLTTADKSGMMVSLIQSNYVGMGSGLVPDGLGFVLQDRGALFTLEPGHANVYAPGKRPFHTIIPAFATKDGVPWLSFGLMGGAMQPQGHVQIICNIVDFGMNVQEAGDAARYRHAGSAQPTGEAMAADGGTLYLESGIPLRVWAALEALGHHVRLGQDGFGGYQMILRDPATGVYHGASEMRKDGQVSGY